jgi:hypothetical protein
MRLKSLMAQGWSPVYLQIDLKDTTISFIDGTTPTANELEITIGEGNVTYTENRNIEYTLDRGLLDEVREGDQVPVDATIDVLWEFLTAVVATAGTPTAEDFLKQRGNAAGYISSDSDVCRPYAIDIEIDHDPSCGGVDHEVIVLGDFRYESIAHDLRAGTLAVTGRCNVTEATVTRVAQPS